MKKFLTILLTVLLFIAKPVLAQTSTQDTISIQDSLAAMADSLAFEQAVGTQQSLDINTIGAYLLNISKMIYWNRYIENFVIGVTDYKTQYRLNQYFSNKTIHGLKVNVIYISPQTAPFTNLIFIPPKKNKNLQSILQNYAGRNVIFVSANSMDWPNVDFVLKPTENDIIIRANKDNLNQKQVSITPLLAGLSMVY